MKIVKSSIILLLVVLLATAFACGGGSGQGSTPTPTPMWVTYLNSSLGFSIQYLQNWTKWETRADGVTFTTPDTEASVQPAVIFVSVYQEEKPVTMSDYVDQCILAMRLYSPGDNISESSETTVAGMPAHKFIFINASAQTPMKRMEVHTIKNNMIYIITYITFESVYTNYLETAQQMIDSFVIY